MKILLIDPLSQYGHKSLNKYIINSLSDEHQVSFISDKKYYLKDVKCNLLYFNFLHDFNLTYRLKQIVILFELIKKIKNYDLVLFTSYETISFSIVSHFYFNRNVFVIEHNNIDQLLMSKIKTFFYSFINKSVTHITFEKYISKYINSKFNKNTFDFPHPLFKISTGSLRAKENIIFSPSSTFDSIMMNQLIDFCLNNDYKLLAKGDKDIDFGQIIIRKHFENYYDCFKHAKFTFLCNNFTYRVSGVVFDSLANNCPIVGFYSRFLFELKNDYPNLVYIIDDYIEINNLYFDEYSMINDFIKFKKDHKFDISSKLVLQSNE